jgi:hypothetical protein
VRGRRSNRSARLRVDPRKSCAFEGVVAGCCWVGAMQVGRFSLFVFHSPLRGLDGTVEQCARCISRCVTRPIEIAVHAALNVRFSFPSASPVSSHHASNLSCVCPELHTRCVSHCIKRPVQIAVRAGNNVSMLFIIPSPVSKVHYTSNHLVTRPCGVAFVAPSSRMRSQTAQSPPPRHTHPTKHTPHIPGTKPLATRTSDSIGARFKR